MSLELPISDPHHWADELAERFAAAGIVVFAHRGPMEHAQLEHLLTVAEEHSLMARVGVSARKRLFNVLVEGLENVRHHTPQDLMETAFAMLVFEGAGYRLFFGNAAPQVTVALLSQRVSILNDMDEADLREHHLKLLANEGRTERGGAGLGLLTMARKSTGPIVTHAFPRDNETAFVALELALTAA
ncbi:MAG: hypothetical protein JNM62_14675 [Flavobacteriales bacterium]|nr:hypothetical protein [Flavobacteriales bacterium]